MFVCNYVDKINIKKRVCKNAKDGFGLNTPEGRRSVAWEEERSKLVEIALLWDQMYQCPQRSRYLLHGIIPNKSLQTGNGDAPNSPRTSSTCNAAATHFGPSFKKA